MDKLTKFRLNANFCKPHSRINKFFANTVLRWWDQISHFTKFVYAECPTITPQQVWNEYNQSLDDVIAIKDIDQLVKQRVKNFQKQMIQTQCLKTIGDTLLDTRRKQAEQRKILTEITRSDFNIATRNDKENQKADVYIINDLDYEIDNSFAIESRIVDLSNWTNIEWNRILKVKDYSSLYTNSRKLLFKDKIDINVQQLLKDAPNLRSLNCLKSWKDKFQNLRSEDAFLTMEIIEFFHRCLRREINVLVQPQCEWDFTVKILSHIIGFLLEEFDNGVFELNWIEKESRSIASRKRIDIHPEYTQLNNQIQKMDLIVTLRSNPIEILFIEAGNTSNIIGNFDDRKYHEDHSTVKIAMKDSLDMLRINLHFNKKDMNNLYIIGIQVSEMATLTVPTTMSSMEDFLPGFIQNLLGLRHSMLDLAKNIRQTAQKRLLTPSPPSSLPHKTSDTPIIKRQKSDPFDIFDDIY
nr:13181_t:CDS:2 [Entrophospora candida]